MLYVDVDIYIKGRHLQYRSQIDKCFLYIYIGGIHIKPSGTHDIITYICT